MQYKNVYVLCPYGLVTGGPDALHQLVYYLKSIGCNSHLVYVDIKTKKYKIPECYRCYETEYLLPNEIIDNYENAIIVPETLTHYLNTVKECKKFIWWLSVDNDLISSGVVNKLKKIFKKIFNFKNIKKIYKLNTLFDVIRHKKFSFDKDCDVTHLCASYYALDYVNKNNKNDSPVLLCVEPISLFFLKNSGCSNSREDIILYNPSKNFKFTKKIIKNGKDLKFIPLKGYSQKELINLYASAKVYIDFGWFPGAERIPKEAVINGCLIITGKNGASAFWGDVPIYDKYKIEAVPENIKKILNCIRDCLSHYEDLVTDFDIYRKMVMNLESNFVDVLKKIFTENYE